MDMSIKVYRMQFIKKIKKQGKSVDKKLKNPTSDF